MNFGTFWKIKGFVPASLILVAGFVLGSERTALVIGNGNYEDQPLPNAVNDATDLAPMLRGFGFTTDLKVNVDRESMNEALNTFARNIKPGGVALFYFAGHGAQLSKSNYLAPLDCNWFSGSCAEDEAIALNDVIKAISESGSALGMIILDACRVSPPRGITRGFAPAGYGSESFGDNLLVIYATKPGDTAADGDGRNGLYTGILLDVMREKPHLELSDFFKEVTRRVKTASGDSQVPWYEGPLDDEFSFSEGGICPIDDRSLKRKAGRWLSKGNAFRKKHTDKTRERVIAGNDMYLLYPKPLEHLCPDLFRSMTAYDSEIKELNGDLDNAPTVQDLENGEKKIAEVRTNANDQLDSVKELLEEHSKRLTVGSKERDYLENVIYLINYCIKNNEDLNGD